MANFVVIAIAAIAFLAGSGDTNGVCYPTPFLKSATSSDTYANYVSIPHAPLCEKGPVRKIFTLRGEFYWPPIYRGLCTGLRCRDPPCFARKTIWRTRCVLVYRFIKGWWKKIGFQSRRYLEHLECGCKRCEDIRSRTTCVTTKPCPNSYIPNSFCYWRFPIHKRPGGCFCCKPYPCPKHQIFSKRSCSCVCPRIKCPPGRVFNRVTCKCDCPKGTKQVHGKCITDCTKLNVKICKFFNCIYNPSLPCAVRNHRCECQTCKDTSSISTCAVTRCLEHRGLPRCVYDFKAKECRCPQCSDITNKFKCITTRPCIGSKNPKSFCYWRPHNLGCDCCTRTCPPGRVLNTKTCRCDCPPRTKEVHGICIGDCYNVKINFCPFVTCKDNPQFRCQRRFDVHKRLVCVCPSCDAAKNIPTCSKTRCLEQRGNPKCVYDFKFRKCRCPQCSDNKEIKWCLKTYCGKNYSFQCRFDPYRKICSCPH